MTFLQKQLDWCDTTITPTTGMIPVWGVINRVLIEVYGENVNQGFLTKQNKILRMLQTTRIPMVDVDNMFKSTEHKWDKDFFTIVDKKDVAELTELVRDIETKGLELV